MCSSCASGGHNLTGSKICRLFPAAVSILQVTVGTATVAGSAVCFFLGGGGGDAFKDFEIVENNAKFRTEAKDAIRLLQQGCTNPEIIILVRGVLIF
jgi:hypothetical protein